jgi:3-isopropylmalate dehydratase small subunit
MGITMSIYTGMAHVFGDNIDTDRIIPGKYTKTLNLDDLAGHVLEDLDPGFRSRVRPGDILVAGKNFGAGSSREQAPLALQAAGVAVVIANFFARIFYRNAINIGLPVVEIGPHDMQTGHEVEVNLNSGWVTDLTTGQRYRATQMPEVMVRILQAGGLVNYLREHRDYV